MRFPFGFKRRVGAGTLPVLGADAVPTTPPGSQDYVFSSPFCNIGGWPGQRLAVAYKGPAGAGNLNVALYIYDEQIGAWFKVPQTVTALVPGEVRFFDILAILPAAQTSLGSTSVGALEIALVVEAAPGPTPDGTYEFSAAVDMSTGLGL